MIGQDDGRDLPADGRRARRVDDGSRILAGRYEVGELIGRGGMAEVHIGYDRRLGRTVAIKILRSDLARDPSFQNRFRREAQAAAALNHPAIVAVYDTGEDVVTEPTGVVAHVPFIVMEYVEGHTVRDILHDGAAVPIEEAVEITAGVLSALEYSHHAGIVHRDIKPANVMLTPTGAVKVMDFGIARAIADSSATMTQTQAVIGTAQYLSPEQARGEQVDTRSDLYSTGCLLFELLTGRPPFTGDSPVAVAYQHVREIPPSPSSVASDVPESLDRVVLKALAKERETRYQTADEFRADLEAVLHGGVVSAPAVGMIGAAVATLPATDATQVLAPAAAATQTLPPTTPPWAATGATTPGAGIGYRDDEDGGRPWVIWLLLAVAVLAVGAIVALLLNNRQPATPDTIAVPNVVSYPEAAAAQAIRDAQLEPVRAEIPSNDVTEGLVVKTDPEAGAEVQQGDPVTYFVSTGPAELTVPNVVGQTVEEASRALSALGLTVDPVQDQVNDPAYEKGKVTQTVPAANEPIQAGGSVKLSVSTGNVELTNLVNMTQEQAMAELDRLNLVGNPTSKEDATAVPGTVLEQERPAGSLLPQGTTVNFTVAQKPTTAQVPDVAGQPYEQAYATLSAAGFTSITQAQQESDQTAGTVLRTDPSKGTNVSLSQTITVYVAQAPTGDYIPDVTDQPNYDAAYKELTDAGFTKVTRGDVSTVGVPGTVTGTTPPAGTWAKFTDPITVNVIKGP